MPEWRASAPWTGHHRAVIGVPSLGALFTDGPPARHRRGAPQRHRRERPSDRHWTTHGRGRAPPAMVASVEPGRAARAPNGGHVLSLPRCTATRLGESRRRTGPPPAITAPVLAVACLIAALVRMRVGHIRRGRLGNVEIARGSGRRADPGPLPSARMLPSRTIERGSLEWSGTQRQGRQVVWPRLSASGAAGTSANGRGCALPLAAIQARAGTSREVAG